MELTTTNVLLVWIEEKRAGWVERGVDILEDEGHVVFSDYLPDSKLVFIGKTEHCKERPPVEENFVPIIVTDEMGVEHCQILIENVVEQVAGR
jgi:hypothetical protein